MEDHWASLYVPIRRTLFESENPDEIANFLEGRQVEALETDEKSSNRSTD